MKKIFVIILIVVLLGGGYWYFFIRNTSTGTKSATDNSSFFPSGSTVDNTNSSNPNNNTSGTNSDNSATPINQNGDNNVGKLEQITTSPIAGFTAFSIKKTLAELSDQATSTNSKGSFAFNSYVRYVSRGNGYVYEIKNGTEATQVSNIYIPNIYEAIFADNNKTALLRFLRDDQKTIATYTVPIPDSNIDNTRTQINGIFLTDNITSITVSPDQKTIGVLNQKQNNGVLTLMTSSGAGKVDLISNPFSEWNISWPTNTSLYLQTKAAGSVNGFLYRVDRKDARLKKVLGDIAGLTTNVSPSGRYVLYSESVTGSFVTKILDTQTGQRLSLNSIILPEKCTWDSSDNLFCATEDSVDQMTYPDAWYAGLTHFNDKLIKINTSNNNAITIIYSGNESTIDATNLDLDESIGYLYFINKNDSTLWRVRTTN